MPSCSSVVAPALKTAARLQRRNVGRALAHAARQALGAVGRSRDRHDAASCATPAAPAHDTPAPLGGWVWLAGALHALRHTRGGWLAGALRVLRRPSLWSFAMFATRWWWRRSRRAAHARAAIAM